MNKTILAFSLLATGVLLGCDKQHDSQQKNAANAVKEVVWEERTDVPAWSAALVQRFRGPESSDDITLDLELVDREGKTKILAENILGPVVVFETHGVIASCEAVGALATGPHPIFITLKMVKPGTGRLTRVLLASALASKAQSYCSLYTTMPEVIINPTVTLESLIRQALLCLRGSLITRGFLRYSAMGKHTRLTCLNQSYRANAI